MQLRETKEIVEHLPERVKGLCLVMTSPFSAGVDPTSPLGRGRVEGSETVSLTRYLGWMTGVTRKSNPLALATLMAVGRSAGHGSRRPQEAWGMPDIL